MATRSRESIYQALFNLVTPLLAPGGFSTPFVPAGATAPTTTPSQPFATITREVIEAGRIDKSAQPVLMMYEMDERFIETGNGLVKQVWTVIFIFGCTTQQGTPGQTVLNPLIDLVASTLQPATGDDFQTLGGLVEKVIVAGSGGKDHGNNSTDPNARQATYYLPVELTLPFS